MKITEWLPEFPVSSEDDVDLMKYFINTSHIKELLTTPKWMILGRKGTGKTAIYRYLQSTDFLSNKKKLCIPLNFREYPWPTHKLYKETMEGEINAYYKSWHYLITVQTLSKFINHLEKNGEKLSGELSKAKQIIQKIYGSPLPSLIEVIKGKLFRVQKIELPSGEIDDFSVSGGNISFEDASKSEELISSLRSNAFSIHNYFEKILSKYINDYDLYVTLDQLDENWLESEIEDYSKILVNLVTVCKSINSESITSNRKLKCILFLRTDIYETLRFNDKNKVYQSSAIEIKWDEKSLNEMFFERIKKYKPSNVKIEPKLKSDSVFEVRKVKNGATPFKHILRRSFYRPRDVIVYFNNIRKEFISSKTGLYTSKQLYAAENGFSLSMYRELIDEWANQKPEIEKYLNILQNISTQKFDYSEYTEGYNSIFTNSQKAEIDNSLNFLFQNSIIGQKINANWEYICTNPHMQINYNTEFRVNNGLTKRLVLTETRAKRKL
ncbi:P-loop ATPase, Sll1717 family [Leptospira limi]|uniref:FunZ protein n=1 Tax=Leptospira limi TaxID=2950023 RepID=A0ABT3M225_9LEPT|nr:hypothetical protein [Leptospira limi]MCW7464034.1 hypothetical protein [Leptospira limi]